MTPRSPRRPPLDLLFLVAGLLLLAAGCKANTDDASQPDPAPTSSAPAGDPTGGEAAPSEAASDEAANADEPGDESPAAPSAQPPGSATMAEAPARLVAIGDVHGDMAATRRALELAGVLGEGDTWIGGETVLVQTGDVLDRGDDEAEIMALLETLRTGADAAGGRVVLLNGNHELMNAMGDLRYVTPGGFEDWIDSPARDLPGIDELPPELRGRASAFMPGGEAARALATRDVVAVIGTSVFVHGGVLPEVADEGRDGIDELNTATRAWLRGEGPPPSFLADPDSPVWSRHFSDDVDAADCDLLSRTLDHLDAERMVVGHTPQMSGITSACEGKVWRIDTGMASHYGGPTQVLEIRGDEVKILAEGSP